MIINKTNENGKLTLALDGRLDALTSLDFQDVLLSAIEQEDYVELDFSGLAYVSSAGLRLLLMGQKAAIAKSGRMVLKGVSEDIMEVLDMTGFSDILTIL